MYSLLVIVVLNLIMLGLVIVFLGGKEDLPPVYDDIRASKTRTIDDCASIASESDTERDNCVNTGLAKLYGYTEGMYCLLPGGALDARCSPNPIHLFSRYNLEYNLVQSCEENFPSSDVVFSDCLAKIRS